MGTIYINSLREQAKSPFARIKGAFRAARAREAEAILSRYTSGRWTDSAEREMTERLLHVGDSFRF